MRIDGKQEQLTMMVSGPIRPNHQKSGMIMPSRRRIQSLYWHGRPTCGWALFVAVLLSFATVAKTESSDPNHQIRFAELFGSTNVGSTNGDPAPTPPPLTQFTTALRVVGSGFGTPSSYYTNDTEKGSKNKSNHLKHRQSSEKSKNKKMAYCVDSSGNGDKGQGGRSEAVFCDQMAQGRSKGSMKRKKGKGNRYQTTPTPSMTAAPSIGPPTASPTAPVLNPPFLSPPGLPVSSPNSTPIASPANVPVSIPPVSGPITVPGDAPVSAPVVTPVGIPKSITTSAPVVGRPVSSSPIATPASSTPVDSLVTMQPVAAPIAIPFSPPADGPVGPPAAPPVAVPAASPVVAPAAAPVTPPAPLNVPVAVPVQTQVTVSPMTTPTSAPVDSPMDVTPSVGVPAASPVSSHPSASPVAVPVGSPVNSPVEGPTDAPILSSVPTPADGPVASPPVDSPVTSPSQSPLSAPSARPVVAPSSSPMSSPSTVPVVTSIAPPATAPNTSPVTAPATTTETMSPTVNVVATTTTPTRAASQPTTASPRKSDKPTKRPGNTPTKAPDKVQTHEPTIKSSVSPTKTPSKGKTEKTTEQPSNVTTVAPTKMQVTAAPAKGEPKTASPTVTLVRRSSPFDIVFGLPGGGGGFDGFDEFRAVHLAVLEVLAAYFALSFEERGDVVFAGFDGEILDSDPSIPSATFIFEIALDPTSQYSPSVQEIDILVELATSDDANRADFLAAFRELGPDNPYSEIETVQYLPRPDLVPDSRGGTKQKVPDVASFSITPFRLSFAGVNTYDESVEATMATIRTTLNYLDEYLSMKFDAVESHVYSHLTGNGKSSGNGQIDFNVALYLSNDLDYSYTRQELDGAVKMAFSLPAVEAFVISLHSLSTDNPYSTITKTDFQFMPDFLSYELPSESILVSPAMIGSFAMFGLCLGSTMCMIAYTCCKPKKERVKPRSVRNENYIPIHGDFDSTSQSSETRVPLGQRHGGQEEFDLSIDSGNDPLIWWSGSSDQS